ncbi:hypothetical protein BTHERMOSOX_1884 [Bathymodiolus thermophilus thioautotrophic gill symbiont]|nr:hypothetical protein BTHERMOSOX_1884 [Bathymodiolus thermophilus thioautotrophic gill symbiont]
MPNPTPTVTHGAAIKPPVFIGQIRQGNLLPIMQIKQNKN